MNNSKPKQDFQQAPIVESINISCEKGTVKRPVNEAIINNHGIISDAHSGPWNRQISILSAENIEHFSKTTGKKINFGEFAENITTRNLDLSKIKVGQRIFIGILILCISVKIREAVWFSEAARYTLSEF